MDQANLRATGSGRAIARFFGNSSPNTICTTVENSNARIERYVYAFVVSIVLFTLGGLFALYEAWHKWQDPHPIQTSDR